MYEDNIKPKEKLAGELLQQSAPERLILFSMSAQELTHELGHSVCICDLLESECACHSQGGQACAGETVMRREKG